MVYSADIRCTPAHLNININLFYDYLDKRGVELHQTVSDPETMKYNSECIEKVIERCAQIYMNYKLFGFIDNHEEVGGYPLEPENFATVFEAMYEGMLRYTMDHRVKDQFTLRKIE